MIRDITIGRYYDSESVIHRMDPRTKLMGVLVYIISLFLVKNVWWYLGCLIVMLVLYRLARVPVGYLLKGLRGILVLLCFTFLFRMLYYTGRCGRICLDIYHNKTGNMESSADDSKDSFDDHRCVSAFLHFNAERTGRWSGEGFFGIGGRLESRYMRWQ